jgi:protocatechuate 3,4-dioxygenase beta subunit
MNAFDRSRRALLLAALGTPFALRSKGLIAAAAAACHATDTSILGPAYRPDAPFRTALCATTEPGTPLRMSGMVASAEGCRRAREAVIDVWQADAAGRYDMESAEFHLRGRIRPDALGRYTFDTIVPGHYGDRARHIHLLATCKGYQPRITQCYFRSDERTASDGLVKPGLTVVLRDAKDAARPGLQQAVFDVTLDPEKPADDVALAAYASYVGVYELSPEVRLTITRAERHLKWMLSPVEQPGDPESGLLYARSGTRFFCPEYDLTTEFVKNETGEVTHMLVRNRNLAKKLPIKV